jgi:hypothetical protein
MTEFAQDHDQLGPISFAQALRQCIADLLRCEILILDIDRTASGRDHIHIERLDFTHAGAAVHCGFGSRDCDTNILDVWLERIRPARIRRATRSASPE